MGLLVTKSPEEVLSVDDAGLNRIGDGGKGRHARISWTSNC